MKPKSPEHERARDLSRLVALGRAKRVLLVVGIVLAVVGGSALPWPQTSPKALTSVFVGLATTGAFTRLGVILICVGVGCLVLAALLPSGPE